MTTPLHKGTRVRVTWEKSSFYRREGVIASQVGTGLYRVEVNGGGTFLGPDEFEVLDPADAGDTS